MTALLSIATACWAIGAGVVAPGLVVVRVLGLGRGALERLVLGIAFGRLLLAAVTLLATGLGTPALLWLWAPLAVVAWVSLAWRRRGEGPPGATPWFVVAPGVLASLALVHAVVGRSGLRAASGSLFFQGRDASFDPLVYLGVWRQLAEHGLPLTRPLLGGIEVTGQYVGFALGAGLQLLGADPLDLAFRALPLLETSALALTAAALVRALGRGHPASDRAAALAGVLTLWGSGAWFLLVPVLAGLGQPMGLLDPWSFFGPYLLPFNPLAAGLQTWLAACLLVARLQAGNGSRAPAVAAGVLVASLIETKLFVWAPALGALAWVAFRPPSALRAPLRAMAATAIALSLPSFLEKLAWGVRLADYDVGARACLGCLPRYLTQGALGFGTPSYQSFGSFGNAELLSPGVLGTTLFAIVFVVAVGLGVRLLAIAPLWRGAWSPGGGDPERAPGIAVNRLVGGAALLGLLLAMGVTLSPHYLNGAQFAATAGVGLWIFTAPVAARWLAARRSVVLALFLLGAGLASGLDLTRLGWGARTSLVLSVEEQRLLEAFAEVSRPDALVLEPSALEDSLRPSPVVWYAGRRVHLSNRAAAAMLPEGERIARLERVQAVFRGTDRAAALAALDASGAGFVYVPLPWRLAWASGDALKPVAENISGVVYRVEPVASR